MINLFDVKNYRLKSGPCLALIVLCTFSIVREAVFPMSEAVYYLKDIMFFQNSPLSGKFLLDIYRPFFNFPFLGFSNVLEPFSDTASPLPSQQ